MATKDETIVQEAECILLSYLTHGARGHTAEEMINRLSIRDIEHLHIGYKSLTFLMNATENAELRVANSIFISNECKLIPTFSSIGTDYYNFSNSQSDFRNAPQCEADKINNWVREKTNNTITEIVQPADISHDTRMILVNAIYFKGTWLFRFDRKNTRHRTFYLDENHDRQVLMMELMKYYEHGASAELNARFIEIPYSDKNLSMVVILPNKINGLADLQRNFNWDIIVNAKHCLTETQLVLPKFNIECTLNLGKILQQHGLTKMFEDSADFSGISDQPLKVDKILQKAFVEVNEEGTEAAVVTGFLMGCAGRPVSPDVFIVDHPFMIVIRHKPSDIPIFIGSVRDI